MKLNIFNILIFIILSLIELSNNTESFQINDNEISEGVYNIILKKKYSSISFDKKIKLSKDKLGSDLINFRLKIIKHEEDKNLTFYTIEHLKTKSFLGIQTDNEAFCSLLLNPQRDKNETLSFTFQFVKVDNNVYLIKSKNGCFLTEENSKIICKYETPGEMSHFYLLKIFSEIDKNNYMNNLILDKSPKGIIIKYIDLSDPNLKREGIHQVNNKDNDNEELRYSIRSILKNIPWIRKIYIMMPNEKVKFFKDYDLIKNKIIYIKDKEFLGHESSNSHAFQFRFWKLKDYGISDNFIIMDDDYFIGQPLNKSDFFYVVNNTVVPAIISTNFQIHTDKTFLREYNNIKKQLQNSREQSSNTFLYTMYNTYFFFISFFKGPIIVPYFTHNAIPSNVNDLKEIYELVYNSSEYREPTLESIDRHIDSLQFQTSVNVYTFNKYSRKVNLVNYNYIDIKDNLKGNYNFPLFCINTGNNKEYSKIAFSTAKLMMEKLFPDPTPYEIIDYNTIPKLAYSVMKNFEDDIKDLKNNEDKEIVMKLKSENEKKKKYIERCDAMIEQYKIKNNRALNKTISLKKELNICLMKNNDIKNEINILEKEKKDPNINMNYEDVKNELDKIIDEEKNNKIKINMYQNWINENKKEIENIQMRQQKLYFIAYLEFGIITIILTLFFGYYLCKKNNSGND